MPRSELVINEDAIEAIRKSPEVDAFLRSLAEKAARAAGPGFVVKKALGANRARYLVVPESREAHHQNAKNLAVVRGLSAAAE